MTVEGTNGFGELLAAELEENDSMASSQPYEAGYSVTALDITDGVATVTYDTLETASIVVAIYGEDGMQMITSGKTEVTRDETVATVEFDAALPAYFMAEAFLLDVYDHSPLCESFTTPMYTQEMQELLASTMADYAPEQVLNLDDSETTNFAVYKENVIQITYVEGSNLVTSVDSQTLTYVIENADEQFITLVEGDIFAYEFGENDMLIAKVASITVDGTTVTIVGADAEMKEIFSHVKLEGTSATEDIVVDASTAAEGVTYAGLVQSGVQTFAFEGGGTLKAAHSFPLEFTKEEESKYLDASVQISGSVDIELPLTFNYYISLRSQYLEFRADPSVTVGLYVSGSVKGKLPIGSFGVSPVPGVYVGFEPKIVLGFDGSLELTAKLSMTIGVKYEDGKFHNLTTSPKIDVDLAAEIKITLGIDWGPHVTVIGDNVAKLGMEMFTGFELVAEKSLFHAEIGFEKPESKHTCKDCLSMSLSFKANITGEITFLNISWLSASIKIGEWTVPLGSMYYSFDHGDFGWGDCPYQSYRVTVQVKKADNSVAADVTVNIDSKAAGTTNAKGVLVTYLTAGNHLFTATVDGKELTRSTSVSSAKKVTLNDVRIGNGIFDESSSGSYSKYANTPDSGQCGADADYHIYDGKLYISGSGKVLSFPWQRVSDTITEVHIAYGITEIGPSAFEGCSNLKKVTIPSSVKIIDDNAFYYCTSLESVVIPEGVTTIGAACFSHCESMTSLTIPSTVTTIERYAIDYCCELTEVRLPYGLKTIAFATFNECFKLRSVYIPPTVETIEDYAFSECHALNDVVIPQKVTTIGVAAFMRCCSLTEITFPAALTYIDDYAFMDCSVLNTIKFVGTQAQWWNVYVGYANEAIDNATVQYGASYPDNNIVIAGGVAAAGTEYNATFSGVYDTVAGDDNVTYHTATFDDLSANKQYTLLVLREYTATDLIAPTNVLFIAQGVSDEMGYLTFSYLPSVDDGVSYIMACGASEKDLNDATITMPPMTASYDVAAISPIVYYEGELLTEGVDYVVTGTADYSQAGLYTCFIRGIYEYTGLVTCAYTVDLLRGDANANGTVNTNDARKLLVALAAADVSFTEPEWKALDMNADGAINTVDVREILLWILLQ